MNDWGTAMMGGSKITLSGYAGVALR